MVGAGEIEGDVGGTLDAPVVMELGPVVGGDGTERTGMAADEFDYAISEGLLGPIAELADEHLAGCSLDQGDDTVGRGVAHDGVDFPMAGFLAAFDRRGAFADEAFARESPAAVVAAVALAPLLGRSPQMAVQCSALALVLPDPLVDGLVADREFTGLPQVTGDLFGTPPLAQQRLDQAPLAVGEPLVAPRARAPAARALAGLLGAIGAVVCTAIALQLAANRAAVAAEGARDLRLVELLREQNSKRIPLFRGDLAVRHDGAPLLGG